MKKNNLIGDKINKSLSDWSFSGNVHKTFDNHINKSVPLYNETHEVYLHLSDFFLQNNSTILDIGCSTGTFLNNVYKRHKNNKKKLRYIGIDSVDEMIKHCNKKSKKNKQISFLKKDIMSYKVKNCCIISSFYTIQFISPKDRQKIINKIFEALNWGGAFFFIEKVRGPDARFQDIFNQLYIEYKLSKGFNADEIINKSKSLKSVLEPFSTKGNIEMLKRAGFKDVLTIFKYSCFEGFLAIK